MTIRQSFSRFALPLHLYFVVSLSLSGCSAISSPPNLPSSLGEQASNYGYVPLDGLAVDTGKLADSCKPYANTTSEKEFPYAPLAQALPDINVRFAVASFDTSGNLTFGPTKLTAKNNSYRAILDYINVDVVPLTFSISAMTRDGTVPLSLARMKGMEITGYYVKSLPSQNQTTDTQPSPLPTAINSTDGDEVTIPVYVGVGLRLTADITAIESGVPLVSLGAIGLGAENKSLIGTLTVQTLGIPGATVAASLPLPSKLDQTTIENAVMAVGANRKEIYNSKAGEIGPLARVVGLYSPIGTDSGLINAIYSELSKNRTIWHRICKPSPGVVASN